MNKAEHKTMPKLMRMPQKIRETKKIWQDETSSKYKASSHDGGASYTETASKNKSV